MIRLPTSTSIASLATARQSSRLPGRVTAAAATAARAQVCTAPGPATAHFGGPERFLHCARVLSSSLPSSGHPSSDTPASVCALLENITSLRDLEDARSLMSAQLGRASAGPAPARSATAASSAAAMLDGLRVHVIKIGGEAVENDKAVLIESLRVMQKLGVCPVIVHGAGPQMNDLLALRGVEPQYAGGHRITDEPTLRIAEEVFTSVNRELVQALQDAGLDAVAFPTGVFEATVADGGAKGFVGEVSGVRDADVASAIAQGSIPVLTSLGVDVGNAPGSQGTLNINADVAARELALSLKPEKVLFVSAGGGWKNPDGSICPSLVMSRDYDALSALDYTGRQGTLLKLNEVRAILMGLPPSSSVVITSPHHLTSHLLPHRGKGTLCTLGAKFTDVVSEACAPDLQPGHVAALFGSRVADLLLSRTAVTPGAPDADTAVIVSSQWDSGAVLTREGPASPWLLTSFAVTPDGLASNQEAELWQELRRRCPALVWACSNDSAPPSAAPDNHSAGLLTFPRTAHLASGHAWSSSLNCHLCWFGDIGAEACVESVVGFPSFLHGSEGLHHHGRLLGDKSGGDGGDQPSPGGPSSSTPSSTNAITTRTLPASLPGGALKLGLIGARGYVARELIRLLESHGDMRVTCAGSRMLAGQRLDAALGMEGDVHSAVDPGLEFVDLSPEAIREGSAPGLDGGVDIWVLALPNGLCDGYVQAIDAATVSGAATTSALDRPVIIDLSADMRFDGTGKWVYGCPERPGTRAVLSTATHISNPGCYATGAGLALLPLRSLLRPSIPPHVFGVSGYSGAGTTPSEKNDPEYLRDNLVPYALTGHIHEREVGHHLGSRVSFSPHVAPFFQGISLTVSAHLGGPYASYTAEMLYEMFAEFYAGEPLVTVLPPSAQMPTVRTHGALHHGVTIGGFSYDPTCGRLVVVSLIDNLLKGAATQALQNLNIASGLPELTGIPVASSGTA